VPDKKQAIELLNRIEAVLQQLERGDRAPQGACLGCLQDVQTTGHLKNCPIGQSLLEIEDWKRTPIPGGVDWT
jgi:hypothetical protein